MAAGSKNIPKRRKLRELEAKRDRLMEGREKQGVELKKVRAELKAVRSKR